MLTQFQEYLTFDNIYLWVNYGIIPFWLMIIFIPNSKITQFFVNSIILPLILGSTYIYIIYLSAVLDENFIDIFKLYLNLEGLYTVFSSESFLLIFWLHFLSLGLFLGSWVSRDAIKYNISRKIVFFPLIMVYFSGPVGLVIYWLLRIFFAKRISLHD